MKATIYRKSRIKLTVFCVSALYSFFWIVLLLSFTTNTMFFGCNSAGKHDSVKNLIEFKGILIKSLQLELDKSLTEEDLATQGKDQLMVHSTTTIPPKPTTLNPWRNVTQEISFNDFYWPPKMDIKTNAVKLKNNLMSKNSMDVLNTWLPDGFVFQPKSLKLDNSTDRKAVVIVRLLIKSKPEHFENRQAIRSLWGQTRKVENFVIQRAFLLGLAELKPINRAVQMEFEEHGDILMGNFDDTYHNTTEKVMMGLKFLTELDSNYDFCILIDDDYHLSIRNLLTFLRRNLDKQDLYNGHLQVNAPVFRNSNDKWDMKLTDYPFKFYPPFISGGTVIMTKQTVQTFYWSSHFVTQIRFDDVYLGIISYLVGLRPTNNRDIHDWIPKLPRNFKWYAESRKKTILNSFKLIISCHQFGDTIKMKKAFENSEKSLAWDE